MSAPAIFSLGSINADFQARVARPLQAGRTLIASDFLRLSGGKAANVAFLARRFGVAATLIGRVGDDDLAEQALGPLRAAGVDVAHVSRARAPTAVSMISVPPDGKKSIVLATNANDVWDEAAARTAEDSVASAPTGSVLAADYEVPPWIVARAIAAAGRRDVRVVLDPSPAERVDQAILPDLFAITPNPKEAGDVGGVEVRDLESAAAAARRLAECGAQLVCVKLDGGGCVLADRGALTHVPGPETKPVDLTGAGDAFTGALAVALLERRDAVEAACFAAAASACAAMGYGSQPSYPTRSEVEARLPWFLAKARRHAVG